MLWWQATTTTTTTNDYKCVGDNNEVAMVKCVLCVILCVINLSLDI